MGRLFFNQLIGRMCEQGRRLLQVSSSDELPAPQRRFLLVGTDFGLTLLVVIVVAVLANMFISADDEANAGMQKKGVALQQADHVSTSGAFSGVTAVEHARQHIDGEYRCPLHPEVVSAMPGVCPICGETLIRVKDGEQIEPVLKLPESNAYLTHVARVERDERRVRGIELLSGEGWVEKLYAGPPGSRVEQGELLLEIYSPELAGLQRAYLDAASRRDMVDLTIAHDRLLGSGQSRMQIQELNYSRQADGLIRVIAPADGIISNINVSEGEFVPRAAEVFTLLDLGSVWMVFELTAEAEEITAAQPVEALLPSEGPRTFKGQVDEVLSLNPQTNSRLVRLRFDADAEVLRDRDFVNVRVYRQQAQLSAPTRLAE